MSRQRRFSGRHFEGLSKSRGPDWLDRDPVAGHELCAVCGRGYVPIGSLCTECMCKARIAVLRERYSADEAEVRAMVELEYDGRRAQALFDERNVPPTASLEVGQVASESKPRYFAGKVLQVWEVVATRGDESDVWLVVGPDPWEMFPAEAIGGVEGALNYYRMTQRYDADGWPLDMTNGKRREKP
jgi:hypothetical protein